MRPLPLMSLPWNCVRVAPAGGSLKRRTSAFIAKAKIKTSLLTYLILGLTLLIAESTPAQKVHFIGSLNTSEQFTNSFDGFKVRMAELGYREGQNVRYEFYNSKGDHELLKTMAEKLAHQKPDMIVTSSTSATVAAVKATEGTRIPVVFLSAGNAQKLIQSFASSASNVAGISSASLELVGKRFELLKELAPKTKRIAMAIDPKGINYSASISEVKQTAAKMGFIVWEIPVNTGDELVKAAYAITRKETDAIFVPPDSLLSDRADVVVKQAFQERLPIVCSLLSLVERGCLASYAADYAALGRQGAVLVDKILKGTKAADLPIEMPRKLNLALNLKTAKAIGLIIPREILLRADELVE
jgi:putative ABC transport system substrate-binding protein